MQPHSNVILVNDLPAGPLDPCILDSVPLDARLASSIGIDVTYPFGSIVDNDSTGQNSQDKAENKLDFFRNSIRSLKWLFLSSFLINFSTVWMHMLSKFIKKPAQKQLIFSIKASFEGSLI